MLSLDDYFLQEVEGEAMDAELGKMVPVTTMEYVYEAEMEDLYKASVLKAFRKTIDQGLDKLIIFDAQNVKVADFLSRDPRWENNPYVTCSLDLPGDIRPGDLDMSRRARQRLQLLFK